MISQEENDDFYKGRRPTVLDKVIDLLEDMKEDIDVLSSTNDSKEPKEEVPKPNVSDYESQLMITQEDNDEIFDDFI